jgi:hypothetical protein
VAPVDGSKRARDSDRAVTTDALNAAYADGQLDLEEHQRRLQAALEAVHVRDLVRLVDDLQVATPATLRRRAAGPRWPRRAAVALPLLALVLGVVGWRVVAADPDDAPIGAPSTEAQAADDESLDQGQTLRWDQVELPKAASATASDHRIAGLGAWHADATRLATFVERWTEEMGPYYTELRFGPATLYLTRPVAATSPTTEGWTFDDRRNVVELYTTTDVIAADQPVLDLRDVDIVQLFENVAHAESDLGLPRAELSNVVLDTDIIDHLPSISIWVEDPASNENAWLETTLGGRVLAEHPYDES